MCQNHSKNKSSVCETVKKEKEIHASCVVTPVSSLVVTQNISQLHIDYFELELLEKQLMQERKSDSPFLSPHKEGNTSLM